jgi:hypothetical protein
LPPKKRAALKKSSSFFVVGVPSLHTFSTLRSSWLLCPQYKPARKMRVSICVHRHLFFQRLLFRPAINLNRNAKADLNYLFRYRFTFSVAVTRSQPYSPKKGLPSLWWLFDCRNTATQSQTKPRKMALFAPLGCF